MKTEEKCFSVFYIHIKMWKVLSAHPLPYRNKFMKYLHKAAGVFFCVFLYVMYPVTMFIQLAQERTVHGILENVAMVFTMALVAIKGFFLWLNMDHFVKMESIASGLQPKLMTEFGINQQRGLKKNSRIIFGIYLTFYSVLVLVGGLFLLFVVKGHSLFFPAYFPFEYENNNNLYLLVINYQYFGWAIAVWTTFSLDTYPGVLIYILSTYMDILGNRISNIGYENKADAHKLLKESIEDHKLLIEFFNLLEELISPGMFWMFLIDALSIVSNLLLLIYFCDNVVSFVWYMMMISGHSLQIVLTCYYGSEYTESNENLRRSVYECNWMDQTQEFKKDVMILVENCLRSKEFRAGGMIPVTLATFMSYMKSSYSTYTVLNHMSK